MLYPWKSLVLGLHSWQKANPCLVALSQAPKPRLQESEFLAYLCCYLTPLFSAGEGRL